MTVAQLGLLDVQHGETVNGPGPEMGTGADLLALAR